MVVWILGLEIAKAFFRGLFLNSKIETDSVNHADSRENNFLSNFMKFDFDFFEIFENAWVFHFENHLMRLSFWACLNL